MPAPKSLTDLQCALANGVEIFGDRWSLLILRDAFLGVKRFEEFHRDLGIARNVLSARLDRLVIEGILTTRSYQENPPRHDYLLTEKGKDLLDVLLALWRWGDRWDPVDEEDRRYLIHRDCGATTHGVVVCSVCGGELRRSNLRIEPLPEVVAKRLTADSTRA